MNGAGSPDGALRWQLPLGLALLVGVVIAAALAGVELVLHQYGPPGDVGAVVLQAAAGLLIGAAVGGVLGTVQWRAAVRARDQRVAADPTASRAVGLRPRAQRTAVVVLPGHVVLGRGAELAAALGARRHLADEIAGTLTVKTPPSTGSWGERVVLTVGPEPSGATAVTISSRPRHPAQLVDHGRNAQNVEGAATWLAGLADRWPVLDSGRPAGLAR
jgi:hypothetical protein